jgi:hypothetical protein
VHDWWQGCEILHVNVVVACLASIIGVPASDVDLHRLCMCWVINDGPQFLTSLYWFCGQAFWVSGHKLLRMVIRAGSCVPTVYLQGLRFVKRWDMYIGLKVIYLVLLKSKSCEVMEGMLWVIVSECARCAEELEWKCEVINGPSGYTIAM